MFTGLVEGRGRIRSLRRAGAVWRLRVEGGRIARGVKPGGSVAVDGCCLTALGGARGGVLSFDVVAETWKRTTLKLRCPGDPVNLERPLRWGQRLGGHLVQGHVDGMARVLRNGERLVVSLPPGLSRYALPKGSIALDGVSLTISARRQSRIEIALIPKTRRTTTLGARLAGDLVNVEVDLMVKARLPAPPRSRPSRGRPPRPRRRGRSAGVRRAGRS